MQASAHGPKTHSAALGDEVEMDASCGPLLVPAQDLELSDHPSIEPVR